MLMVKRLLIALALLLLMLSLSYCRCESHSSMETLTVDNLVAQTSIQLNSATPTTLCAFDVNKKETSYAGSGCGPGSAIGALSAAGGATCVATGGGGATPSVSVSTTTYSAGVNLSTLGTIDWVKCSLNLATPLYANASAASVHFKRTGGWLYRSLTPTGAFSTATASDLTFTSTASDDSQYVAMSDAGYCDLFSTSSQLFGFNMKAPANTSQRVLRLYAILREDTPSNCTVDVTGTLSVSGTSGTANINATGITDQVATITFTGGVPNDELVVVINNKNPSSSSCVIAFVAASLGTT